MESLKLLETYRKEKALSSFSVPAFVIADLDLELKFSVAGIEEKEEEGKAPSVLINVSASSLEILNPSQLQIMKLRIAPLPVRAYEEPDGK